MNDDRHEDSLLRLRREAIQRNDIPAQNNKLIGHVIIVLYTGCSANADDTIFWTWVTFSENGHVRSG